MNNRKLSIVLIFLCVFQNSSGQDTLHTNHIIQNKKVFGLTPVGKSTRINGVALGLWTTAFKSGDTLQVKGLSIELDPWMIIAVPYAAMALITYPIRHFSKNKDTVTTSKNQIPDSVMIGNTSIEGVAIGILGSTESPILKGFGINGIMSIKHKMYGMTISGLVNSQYEFKGISVAGLVNSSNKGKGVQMGLINSCKTGNIVQIGLINKIGRRITPLINFRFKKSNK